MLEEISAVVSHSSLILESFAPTPINGSGNTSLSSSKIKTEFKIFK